MTDSSNVHTIATTCLGCGAKGEQIGPSSIVHKTIYCETCIATTPASETPWPCPCGAQITNEPDIVKGHVKICEEAARHVNECYCRGVGGVHKFKPKTPGHITVSFDCAKCKAVRVPVEVPARAAALDLTWWTKHILDPRIIARHKARGCKSRVVMLHVPQADLYGNAARHFGGTY